MSDDLDNRPKDHLDETEFEASLVSDTHSNIGESTGDISVFATIVPPYEAPQPPAMPSWTGKILGHFKLLRTIGEGRMGMVIQAQDINLHRIVALKVLNKRLPGIDKTQRVMQFLREARAAAQIEHPNVVRIYEINQHSGWWYIAMELIEGGNLRSMIKAGGPLSPPRACSFIADAAAALSVAHAVGIVHRDIKPTNLMLTRQGRCKLTDFGLVRIDDPNDPFDFTDKAVGSPQFMAPEMIERKAITPAVDVYSLGNTLYYALVGEAPYTGSSIDEILRKHLSAPIPDVRTRLPRCPASLASLIARMMAKSPAERPSAADVAAALRAETVGENVDDSGIAGPAGSSLLQQSGSTILAPEQTAISSSILTPAAPAVRSRWTPHFIAIAIVLTLVVLAIFFAAVYLFRSHGFRKPDLGTFFSDAPAMYGVLAPSALPKETKFGADDKLRFNWVGKVETGDMRFAASRTGLYFYPITSTDALLIRAENFVGYKTEAEALADGKSPAPR
jgi:serine/threonine protein kinase